jgi:hypothetical protein
VPKSRINSNTNSNADLGKSLNIRQYKNKVPPPVFSNEIQRTLEDISFLQQMSYTHTESFDATPMEEISQIVSIQD